MNMHYPFEALTDLMTPAELRILEEMASTTTYVPEPATMPEGLNRKGRRAWLSQNRRKT